MIIQQIEARLARFIIPGLFVTALIGSCSKPTNVEPEPPVLAQYALTTIRYFLTAGDRIDTLTVQLKGLSVQNVGDSPTTQRVERSLDSLVKTSQFEVDPQNALPKGVDLSQLAVSVPEHGYSDGSFGYSVEKFPLSATQHQKPYGGTENRMLTVAIPAKSRIDISRQIDAYQLTCSFQAVLTNKTTGQRYNLSGRWRGLLEYNNGSTTWKQYRL